MAAAEGHVKTVESLIEKQAAINMEDDNGLIYETILMRVDDLLFEFALFFSYLREECCIHSHTSLILGRQAEFSLEIDSNR